MSLNSTKHNSLKTINEFNAGVRIRSMSFSCDERFAVCGSDYGSLVLVSLDVARIETMLRKDIEFNQIDV